jgi:hypothetical protein
MQIHHHNYDSLFVSQQEVRIAERQQCRSCNEPNFTPSFGPNHILQLLKVGRKWKVCRENVQEASALVLLF